MKLTVGERLVLMSVIPSEGDFVMLKVIRKLQEDLSFSEEEHKQYKFVQAESRVSWNDKADQDKEVEIGEKAKDIIVLALSKLNDEKKLKFEHFTLYEKFIDKK
jgi:hypothetical protein